MVHKITIIATAISEIRGTMTDKDFADALGEFTQGKLHPSPATIQKYRTGQRQPGYDDFSTILDYGRQHKLLSPLTAQRLADFFHLTELRAGFAEMQQELYTLQTQLAQAQEQIKQKGPKKKPQPVSVTIESNLCEQVGEVVNIPILAQIPLNYPLNLEENCEGYVTMPRNMLSGSDYFFLKIFGDAMSNAGINDGDLVLVRRSELAEDGQTVIARVNGQDICKRFFRTAIGIILLPADHNFKPLQTSDIQLIGIVEKVTRNI